VGSDENHGRSMRPGAENHGWLSTGQVLGGRVIERSGDAICGLHRVVVSPDLASKPIVVNFSVWPSKPATTV
jgi:hypothetical protein